MPRQQIKKLDDYGDVLTVYDLCEILKLKEQTVRKYLNKGIIPHTKIGREFRILKSDLIISLSSKSNISELKGGIPQ